MRILLVTLCFTLTGCGVLAPIGNPFGAAVATDADDVVLQDPADGLQADLPDENSVDPGDNVPASITVTGDLGVTVASLGDPSRPGFWLETPLVQTEQLGAVRYNGKSTGVTLIPTGGAATAGSRLSLMAMQELGAPLTDLVEVSVFAGT